MEMCHYHDGVYPYCFPQNGCHLTERRSILIPESTKATAKPLPSIKMQFNTLVSFALIALASFAQAGHRHASMNNFIGGAGTMNGNGMYADQD